MNYTASFKTGFSVAAVIALLAFPAIAQETALQKQEAALQAAFPALPPSRICTPKDVLGVWKMAQVYQEPAGKARQDFIDNPFHYVRFDKNSMFGEYENSKMEQGGAVLKRLGNSMVNDQQQYLVHDSGIMFLYQNGASTGSMACFIVTDPHGEFKKGQMLLMPPAPTDGKPPAMRLVKVYEHPAPPPRPPARRGQKRR